MAVVTLNAFGGGLNTRLAPHLIGKHEAVVAENVSLDAGIVTPLQGPGATIATVASTVSVYPFKGTWFTHSAERWFCEEGNTLYWADGGIPQKRTIHGKQARLGILPPLVNSTPGVTRNYFTVIPTSSPFPLTEWEYWATYYSDPLEGGWGGESAPVKLGTIETRIGRVYYDPVPSLGVVVLRDGTYNRPPGGTNGYLNTHARGVIKIGDTYVSYTGVSFAFGIEPSWQASTDYSSFLGRKIVPSSAKKNGWLYELTTAGTTGATEPTWPVFLGATVTDGTCVWTFIGEEAEYAYYLSGCTTREGSVPPAHFAEGTAVHEAIQSVTLTLPAIYDPQVSHVRVYRTSGNELRLVTETSQTSYTDKQTDDELGDVLAATDGDPPYCFQATLDINAAPSHTSISVTSVEGFRAGQTVYLEGEGQTKAVVITSVNASSKILTIPAFGGTHTFKADTTTVTLYPEGITGPFQGMLVYWGGNIVGWTKAGDPDASPATMRYTFPSRVAACAVFGGFVAVFCEDGVYTLSGADNALARHKTFSVQGCHHGRTLARIGGGILYLSPDGVCLFDGVSSRVISEAKLDRAMFEQMTSPHAAFHDGRYHLFHDDGCLIGDFRWGEPRWTTATVTADSACVHASDDALYLARDGAIVAWGKGTDLAWRYHTGKLRIGDAVGESSLHTLILDGEDCTVEVQVDEKTFHNRTHPGRCRGKRSRLPGSARGNEFQLRVSGTGTLNAIALEYVGPVRRR